jgi:hypothetical protein
LVRLIHKAEQVQLYVSTSTRWGTSRAKAMS